MTLLCLAIVGKNNEPLFLCDCSTLLDKEEGNDDVESLIDEKKTQDDDIFGFAEENATKGLENNLSLDKEVRFL